MFDSESLKFWKNALPDAMDYRKRYVEPKGPRCFTANFASTPPIGPAYQQVSVQVFDA
jgi:hypothetical protein